MKNKFVYVPPVEGAKELFNEDAIAACSTADGHIYALAQSVGHTVMAKPNSAPDLARMNTQTMHRPPAQKKKVIIGWYILALLFMTLIAAFTYGAMDAPATSLKNASWCAKDGVQKWVKANNKPISRLDLTMQEFMCDADMNRFRNSVKNQEPISKQLKALD